MTHQAPVGATVEWYTPPEVFDRLGLTFDLDPCAPAIGAEWVPAAHRYAIDAGDNGLWLPWEGRVWLNPPYGEGAPAFVARIMAHGDGIALLPARTETRWWQAAVASADIVAFCRERLAFVREDGYQARADHASVLMGWGAVSVTAIEAADFGWTVKPALLTATAGRSVVSTTPPAAPVGHDSPGRSDANEPAPMTIACRKLSQTRFAETRP